jgi:16S rRNA (cytosine967-C5)-methyltransferase
MAVSPARSAAFTILLRVEREQSFAAELLHSSLLDNLSAADRNLATEVVMGVLRWRSALDRLIAHFSFTPFPKLDLEVVTALRMGAYQLAYLSRIPAHAAVNETVELVKKGRKASAAGLANAVMRKILAAQRSAKTIASAASLAERFAHPEWLVRRWNAQFGFELAEKICDYDQHVPATALRLDRCEDEEQLLKDEIELAPGALMKNARIVASGEITAGDLFRSRAIAIQDEGSQLVAALVGNGRRILDCCAAPGNKTAAMATRFPEAEVFAAEIYPHRARLLRQMAAQANVHVVTADALQLPFGPDFDRVLADVPCSGTGTLARNPEIKWRLEPADLNQLRQRQIAILSAALRHVAPGGRLVYSTCSLQAEENEQVVEAVVGQEKSLRLVPVHAELSRLRDEGELVWKDIEKLVSGNFLRTLPGLLPCDGFFAAVLERPLTC